ncbi:MAG TPA: hypothetical protein VEX15_23340 [Nocardioidaceae bacterium]|nr:hypothetical protein [Nocardioidaceae bacterium]
MSTVTRPRGPLPPRVYWVRRLALLAMVVLLVWLGARWIGGGGSQAAPSGGDDATAAASSDDDDSTRSDSGDDESRDRTRTDRVRAVAESFEQPSEHCDLTQVLVTPTVAEPVYAGEPVTVHLRISTSSSTACSLSIDADHLLLSITSGDDNVWDSTHCEDAIPTRDLALQPRWSALVDVTWSGLYSGRRCPSGGTAAEPGTYSIEAAVLEGEPTETDVELVERPDPVEDDKTKGDDESSDDVKGGDDQVDDDTAASGQT